MPSLKDKNGTWLSRFYYTDYQGKRIQKKKRGFSTKREALEYEREFLAKTQFESSMTFKSLYELYCEDMKTRIRESTLLTKNFIVQTKILPFFGEMKLTDITPVIVRKWQNELLGAINGSTGKKYSETYIKTINNQLVAIFNYSVKYHSLKENPSHKAGSIGKKNAEEMNIWTKDEFDQFIKTLEHKPLSYAGFNLLFWGGIRIGELLALTVEDVDFQKKVIRINKSYQRLNREDVITPPKTPKSNRVIDMPERLSEILKDYIGNLYKIAKTERIFPVTKYNFEHDMKNYSLKSGVKRIRIHDLRHSHASLLIHLGISPLLISQRLGHEKVETTLNTYSHLYPQATAKMVESMDGMK